MGTLVESTFVSLDGEFARHMNSLPKYVVSNTLQKVTWNATGIKGDVARKVTELKQEAGQYILKYGTGPLDRLLVEHRLVDEFHFWFCPVVAGKSAQRLFEDIESARKSRLVKTTPFRTALIVLTYVPES